jgi:pilus assembly protein CpaE
VAARRALRGILVTTDPAVRESVQGYLRSHPQELSLALELAIPFREFGAGQVREVRETAPGLLLLDLDEDPAIGLALVRHLIETAPDLTVVAIGNTATADLLLNAMRAGVAEFLPKPVTETSLDELVRRVRGRLERSSGGDDAATESGQVHVFFSAKGGSGSTTCATNFAVEVHRRTRKKTLLVDLEPELGETSLLLGMQPKFNFVDLIQNFHRVDQGLLASYIERHSSGVHLLSAPFRPDSVPSISEEQIRRVLSYLRAQYDYVVVDAPKSFGPATLAAFEAADRVFLLAAVDLPSLRNIQRALPLIRRVTPAGDHHTFVVINRYSPSGEVTIPDIEKALQMPVFATLANDYESVIASINTSKPVVLNGRTSAYAKSIRQLVDRVLGEAEGGEDDQKGLISKLSGIFRVPAGARKKEE